MRQFIIAWLRIMFLVFVGIAMIDWLAYTATNTYFWFTVARIIMGVLWYAVIITITMYLMRQGMTLCPEPPK